MTTRTRLLALVPFALVACGEKEWRPSESTLPVLEDPGLWDVNDMVLERNDDPDVTVPEGTLAESATTVVYSNFDGVTLVKGADNALKNSSQICGGTWAKSSASEAKKAMLQKQMQAMMNDFNIVLTLKRPTMGTYDMIVIGAKPSGCDLPGAGGVAPLDCGNRNRANVCFDFSSSGSVITMAQEIGHTYGLGHNDVACDVMGASYTKKSCTTGKWGYIDMAGPLIGGSGCGTSSQNSYMMMKSVLGAWPGGTHPDPTGDGSMCMDMTPPTAKITAPMDGATVMQPFDVMAEGSDDCGIKNIHVDIPEDGITADCAAPPCKWTVDGLPPGKKTVKVTSTDPSGKTTVAMIGVTIPGAGGGGAGGGGGGGGGGGQGGGGGNGQGGSSGGGKVGGAGCTFGGSGTTAPAGLGLLLAAIGLLVTRRRR